MIELIPAKSSLLFFYNVFIQVNTLKMVRGSRRKVANIKAKHQPPTGNKQQATSNQQPVILTS